MSTLVITNPVAGSPKHRAATPELLAELGRRGDVHVHETEGPGHAREIARKRAEDVDRVLVCGGDGTVGEAASGLMDSGVSLGIVPTGTTNVLARECGIPLDPKEALALLLDGNPGVRTLQLWRAGDRDFVLGMGAGYDARLMKRTGSRRRGSPFSLFSTAFTELFRYDFPRIEVKGVDEEGEVFDLSATYLLVCNTKRYAGSFLTAPWADPEDRALDLVLFQARSRAALWLFWTTMMTSGSLHLLLPFVKQTKACRFSVQSGSGTPVEVQVNGDFIGTTPIKVEPAGRTRFLVGRSL